MIFAIITRVMPNIKAAKKSVRSDERKRIFNDRRRRAMRQTVKRFVELVAQKNAAEAKAMVPELYANIDKAVKRGVIKANTGARKKSRLIATLKKVEA
ncbi:MAG: 30S ribosomal protein S20 [Candidatus Pacebacteria bacterium]|nr:30S ribosomal protein S20 [Candidatus Paceibacterota bacterium]MCD8528296.1 30S ribosomal protein S20 [Candidatus Paceibacterota bacterium]